MSLYTEKVRLTPEGGIAVRLTNKTGSASVKGTLCELSPSVDSAVVTVGANEPDVIGVMYESGIADGSDVWVVIQGVAEVLLKDTTASTRGY